MAVMWWTAGSGLSSAAVVFSGRPSDTVVPSRTSRDASTTFSGRRLFSAPRSSPAPQRPQELTLWKSSPNSADETSMCGVGRSVTGERRLSRGDIRAASRPPPGLLEVGEDRPGCVLPGDAGDPAARVRASSAQVEAVDPGQAVARVAEEGAPREELVEGVL